MTMGVGVRSMALFRLVQLIVILILGLFWLSILSGELLVQLPQLGLELLEGLGLGFILGVALQVAAPPVFILPEDVFGGTHWESIAGHFICASEGGKRTA